MKWTHIVMFGILVIIIVCVMYAGRRESYLTTAQLAETTIISTPLATVVGGTVSSKMIFPDHSTVVRKLLGNSGETIILLHNTPFDQEVWDPIFMYVQTLKNTGSKIPNLLCYDLLGHGTAWVPVPREYDDADISNHVWEFREFTEDLHDIYKKYVRSGKVTVVGYGFGGSVAQAFAIEHPDMVKALYVLATTIGPTETGIPKDNLYLSQWIAKNPLVTYLTMEQQFVQYTMCLWFPNNDQRRCPTPQNAKDDSNSFGTVEYLLADKMFREASCQTFLQINKLRSNDMLRPRWENARLNFPCVFLIGNLDHYTNIDTMKKDMKIVKRSTTDVTLYIVRGKHGFPLLYPEYIYRLVSGENMSSDPLTLETIK